MERRRPKDRQPSKSGGRDILRSRAGAKGHDGEPTERTSLLSGGQSSYRSQDVLRNQATEQRDGKASSHEKNISFMDTNALFERDMNRYTKLSERYYGAQGKITQWKDNCPDKELGASVEKFQIGEIDTLYESHKSEIDTEIDLRKTMAAGPSDSFLGQSFAKKAYESFFPGPNLGGLQKTHDVHDETMRKVEERQGGEWTSLMTSQSTYRETVMGE